MIIIECIPEGILDHGVDQLAVVHSVTITALHDCIGSHGHVFHTACDYDIRIACNDHICCHVDTVQTGTAYDIDGNSRDFHRKTGLDGSLSCHVLALACLDNTAHQNFADLICRNACAVKSLLDDDGTKIGCRSCAESAAHFADRCTDSAGEYYFLCHKFSFLS